MIFIMIGTNDLKWGVSQETIVSNYRKILQSIQNQSPKTKVFVQSLLPRKANFQKRIESINHELLMLSKEYGFVYVDLYPAFLDKSGAIKIEYSNDALHLLGAGYLKWKELIEPYILDRGNK
jgi:lysophospholipase L1-like esterase